MMNENIQMHWATLAAEHHDAYDVLQVVMIVTHAYHFKSEAAAFEVVRLMKMDSDVYGGCFRGKVI